MAIVAQCMREAREYVHRRHKTACAPIPRVALYGTSDTFLDSAVYAASNTSVAVSTRRWGRLYVVRDDSPVKEYRVGATDADTMIKSVLTFYRN